ncbi:hypothetical protein LXL04_023074 [Taraxacum kok-saghyz]
MSEKPPRILKGSNIVVSKYARDAQIVSAEFVKSSVETEACPSDGSPEFALVGRSNVGKSSLLNSIVKRKKLVLTSKKPGKTQCINHFRINDSWYIVDLPGYGYAFAPHELKQDWNKFTKYYFLNRSTLVSVFLLHEYTKEYYGIKEHGQMVVHQRPQLGHWITEADVVELEALVTQLEEEHARLLKQVI